MKHFLYSVILSPLLAAAAAGCAPSTAHIEAVRDFKPESYMGVWHEIARLPHRFERGLDQVTAEYTLLSDGSIRVVNRGFRNGEPRSVTGVAKLKAPGEVPLSGELRVSFFRPFYADYRIIEWSEAEGIAVVTGSTTDYLWILARTPTLPADRLAEIVDRLADLGFETENLEYPRP